MMIFTAIDSDRHYYSCRSKSSDEKSSYITTGFSAIVKVIFNETILSSWYVNDRIEFRDEVDLEKYDWENKYALEGAPDWKTSFIDAISEKIDDENYEKRKKLEKEIEKARRKAENARIKKEIEEENAMKIKKEKEEDTIDLLNDKFGDN